MTLNEEYKEYIHQQIEDIEDTRFLCQIFTIIYRYVKRKK